MQMQLELSGKLACKWAEERTAGAGELCEVCLITEAVR